MSEDTNRRSSISEVSKEKLTAWSHEILTLSFNQDCTSLMMGTKTGYGLFTINQENKPDDIHDGDIQPVTRIPYMPYQEVFIIERLFSSALLVLGTREARRKLKVCHYKKGTEICSYSFADEILSMKMNRLRLIVCLEKSIFILNMRDMKVLHTLRDLPSNPDGLCALSPNDENSYLAYPANSIAGEIQIFDTINLKPTVLIAAHDSPLAAMAFDSTGTKLATASNKGTVIRIYNTSSGAREFEFRRGMRRFATIYSLAFSPDSTFLAASSSTGTIHVFRLIDPNVKEAEQTNNSSWMSSFGRVLGGVTYYLPGHTCEVLTQDRAFATVHLQTSDVKTIVAMNVLNKVLKLFVACYNGIVYTYEVNVNEGGECKQISQCHLFGITENSVAPSISEKRTNDEAQVPTDQSKSIYPPNVLKFSEKIPVALSPLTNSKHVTDQCYQTAVDEDNFQQAPCLSPENNDD